MKFIGLDVKLKLKIDSSAARGTLARQGVGKLRHLEVKTLWAQQLVNERKILVKCSIKGSENPRDIGTKVLNRQRIYELKKIMNVRKRSSNVRAPDELQPPPVIKRRNASTEVNDVNDDMVQQMVSAMRRRLLFRA